MCRQRIKRLLVFLRGFRQPIFGISNSCEYRMQPVVVRIKVPRRIEEGLRFVSTTDIDPCLGCTEIQADIAFGRFCYTRIEIRGVLRPAGEAVGVGELRFYVGAFIWNSLQCGQSLVVLTLIPVLSCYSPQNFWIMRGAALCSRRPGPTRLPPPTIPSRPREPSLLIQLSRHRASECLIHTR